MVLKRIDPMSLAKVMGGICGLIGLAVGLIITLIALLAADVAGDGSILFGVGAILYFPIMYGFLGFFVGLLEALLYNVVAERIGGVELEFE